MRTFIIKGLKFKVLVSHIRGAIPSANDWSEMRWILVGPSTDSDLNAAVEKLRVQVSELPLDAAISDEFFATAVVGDKVNLWLLDVFPALFIELFHGQLLPAPLVELESQGNVCCWITQQVGNVRQSIMDEYLISVKAGARKSDDAALFEEIDQTIKSTWTSLTPQVLEFAKEFLNFLHEFLIARFGPRLSFEKDVHVASIWLGESFEVFLQEKRRADLASLRDVIRRTKVG